MRSFSSILWAVSLFASAGVVSATNINIALLSAMGNTSYEADVVSKIQTNAPFLNITVINVGTGTITPSPDLSAYAAVMVIGNNSFANPGTLGDSLKSFVDAGHGVVIAAFSNVQPGSPCPPDKTELCGGFLTSDYWAIEPGAFIAPGHLALGTVHVPNSPLMVNVHTFDGGSAANYINGSVNAAATDVADWSNGKPLIAIRTIGTGTVIGLNFYPLSNQGYNTNWLSTTDGGMIMANALANAGGYSGSAVPEAQSFMLSGMGLVAFSLFLRLRRC